MGAEAADWRDADDRGGRRGLYRRLARRNRFVSGLRLLVPACGFLALGLFGLQILRLDLGPEFEIGPISIDRETITVAAPRYGGVTAEGLSYRVEAGAARASVSDTDTITLSDALISATRADGSIIAAQAGEAVMEVSRQLITVPGTITLTDTLGSAGTITGMALDFPARRVSSAGGVSITFADGARLEADRMEYDAQAGVTQFSNVRMRLLGTPGVDR
ncbi:hypothetical protein EMQ25_13640 [Arsenicitalea aurantiaca]|uniref:LPS export ABC transporter periplasmic protein LptC n=1 Tax=Arsenicitalea aurantiaca TaxID=1783274 RepID=A0A433X8I0_9HYPH|nr:hypothetical protein [Arsenicitalea aurantiaca]RUT30348.1 hypothetical protein EMQ25_13640 [Arsenicitalea aurantiaca]